MKKVLPYGLSLTDLDEAALEYVNFMEKPAGLYLSEILKPPLITFRNTHSK